ncbi:MAG: YqjF family protein [Methanobacteriota archaeon]
MFSRRWLEMTWRDGLFAHWPVDPATVAASLPDALSVATHDGDAYLGVVPFVMDEIRPRGVPMGLSFPELNLRTYVEGPNGPGVYFHSLDADDRLGVAVARGLFRLPYYHAETDVRRTAAGDALGGRDDGLGGGDGLGGRGVNADEGDAVRFASRRVHEGAPHARFDATYAPAGEAFTPEPGSLSAFLLENYRFYTAGSGGRLYVGEIDHDPWTLRPAAAEVRANTLFAANGFEAPDGEPTLHYAEPIAVTADRIRRV